MWDRKQTLSRKYRNKLMQYINLQQLQEVPRHWYKFWLFTLVTVCGFDCVFIKLPEPHHVWHTAAGETLKDLCSCFMSERTGCSQTCCCYTHTHSHTHTYHWVDHKAARHDLHAVHNVTDGFTLSHLSHQLWGNHTGRTSFTVEVKIISSIKHVMFLYRAMNVIAAFMTVFGQCNKPPIKTDFWPIKSVCIGSMWTNKFVKNTHRVFDPLCVLCEVSHQGLHVALCFLQSEKKQCYEQEFSLVWVYGDILKTMLQFTNVLLLFYMKTTFKTT